MEMGLNVANSNKKARVVEVEKLRLLKNNEKKVVCEVN